MQGLAVVYENVLYFMACVLSNREFAEQVVSKADSDIFLETNEFPFKLIWSTLKDYYNVYRTIPNLYALLNLIKSRAAQDHWENSAIVQEAERFILGVSRIPSEYIDLNTALQIYQLLLSRYSKAKLIQGLNRINGDESAFEALLTRIHDNYLRCRATTVVSDTLPTQALERLENTGDYISTGVSFVDKYMTEVCDGVTYGGARAGQVYVLLGPTGVGKSLLSMQLCTQQVQNTYIPNGTQGILNIYVSYEMSEMDLAIRALSQIGRLNEKKLYRAIRFGTETLSDTITDFDRLVFNSDDIPSERYRYEQAKYILDTYIRILDFSGQKVVNGATLGYGGIDEIAEYIKYYSNKYMIGTVIIDWAGAAVTKYLSQQKRSDSNEVFNKLNSYVTEAHAKIAAPYNCIVWVVHQIAGNAGKTPAHKPLHHTDAANCKSFSNFAWYSFCIGRPYSCANGVYNNEYNDGTKVNLFVCSKARSTTIRSPSIVTLEPNLVFKDVSDQYILEPSGIYRRGNAYATT